MRFCYKHIQRPSKPRSRRALGEEDSHDHDWEVLGALAWQASRWRPQPDSHPERLDVGVDPPPIDPARGKVQHIYVDGGVHPIKFDTITHDDEGRLTMVWIVPDGDIAEEECDGEDG
jgi:hypothetical protein